MLLPDSKTELVRRGNKVVYDLGDKIVKVFNETKPVSDVFNEALNLARINECGIRSPKALEVSQLENANGWALVTEKVPGTTLAEKMTAEPQRFGEYLEMFVDLQIEIHGYTSPLLNRQRDKYARMIDSLDQLNATTRYNLQERLDGMTKEFKVCHGDFNPSNVIVGDDGQLYVCDWAHATQGSPAADVATTYLLFALSLLFFRVAKVEDTFYIYRHLLDGFNTNIKELRLGLTDFYWIVFAVAVVMMFAGEQLNGRFDLKAWSCSRPTWLRWSMYVGTVVLIFLFGAFGVENFIYIQF